MTKEFTIADNEAGERLDIYLANRLPDYSRSYFNKLIKMGEISVNGKAAKSSYKTKINDQILIHLIVEETSEMAPEPIELKIIYEDENVIVINKQAGLVVHPASSYKTGTLINALVHYLPQIKEAVFDNESRVSTARPGLVHRLDKDTSGVMIIAKNPRALHSLSRQIQNRTVKKVYWALCAGWPQKEFGQIVNYIGRSQKDRKVFASVAPEKGRIAISDYKVLKYFKCINGAERKLSLIEFDIKTGRTHQIRVHAKLIGHPVLGDQVYLTKESEKISSSLCLGRQMLHARELSITLPGENKASTFVAPLPDDFESIIANLSV